MPLTARERAYFEPRFGQDLSGIRLHTHDAAAAAAASIDARAYTFGRDIAFARGQYRPDTAAGRHLIAMNLPIRSSRKRYRRFAARPTVSEPRRHGPTRRAPSCRKTSGRG